MNVEKIIGNVIIPKMVQVQQTFERDSISAEKIRPLIFELMNQPKFDEVHWVGKRICITAGSRGICNIVEILKSLVSFCKEKGAKPFLVPAMGSHGGATSEGQLHMLEHLGITPESVGCPVWRLFFLAQRTRGIQFTSIKTLLKRMELLSVAG